MTRIISAASAIALLSAPMAAQAQESSSVTLTGDVQQACVLGEPTVADLDLGDLTGDDGRLDSGLTGASVAQSTTIDLAWCNTPSVLSVNASPLTLVTAPAYATPAGFSRMITYDATVSGYASVVVDRPIVGDSAKTAGASTPWAADPLEVSISRLATLDTGGTTENSAFLEAGEYSGVIVIGLSAQ